MSPVRTEIKVRLLQQLYTNNKRGAVFNLLTSLYVFLYFSTALNVMYFLLPWYIGMVALSAVRWIVASKAAALHSPVSLNQWFKWFFLIILINGVLWGMLYPLLYQEMNEFQRLFTTLIMFGGATISILSLGPSWLCYFAFILPLMAPIFIINWPLTSLDSYFFNTGLFIYLIFTIYIFYLNYRHMVKNFNLMIRQDSLITDLRQVNEKLEHASITDSMTGLYNRGYFSDRLATDWAHCKRARLPIAMLIIDIDFFKEYNDAYGHLKGDECLRIVAAVLKEVVTRETDFAARFGGDEMAVILYNTGTDGARKLANQVIKCVRQLHLEHKKSPKEIISISIGAASMVPHIDGTEEQLIMMADHALYRVKKSGRDGLEVHSSSI